MKKRTFVVFVLTMVVAFSGLNLSYAKGLTIEQVQAILGLLKSFGAPQEVIEKVQVVLNGGTPTLSTDYSTYSSCPQITRTLYLGTRGKDVAELQEFLKEKGYFNYPKATGYFGTLTLKAVQRFQMDQGIVSGGDPQSTGFGVVGPKTRAAINKLCAKREHKTSYCTLEYDPVCGKKSVSGYTEYKTYTNMCVMQNSGAVFVNKGACSSSPKVCPQVAVPPTTSCKTSDGVMGTWKKELKPNGCYDWVCKPDTTLPSDSKERITNLKSASNFYKLSNSIDGKGSDVVLVTWNYTDITNNEWMALLLKDKEGKTYKSVRIDPRAGQAKITLDTMCNAYFSDAIDRSCTSLRNAAAKGKTFYVEAQLYTPKNACFGFCSHDAPKAIILEKDSSNEFNIALFDY